MMKELGVSPRNMANSSPLVWEDLVFVETSNGRHDEEGKVLAPRAPSFLAVNRLTGKVVWQDSSPGDRILHGQWSSPALGEVNGVVQVVFPGGDGWLYAFNARTGAPLWRFDLNPKDAVWPKTRNYGLATPVFHGGRVFMAVGQDPESGEGVGHLYCIDPSKSGDITETGRVWQYDKIRRSISTAAVADELLYISDFSGFLHCLDAATGKAYLDVRHAGGGLGLAAGRRRQGVPRRRGRRRRRAPGRQGDEEARRGQHGERRLRRPGARQRRALHHEPFSAVRHRGGTAAGTPVSRASGR